jgi:DNA-binding MarR family transcriptional regulator
MADSVLIPRIAALYELQSLLLSPKLRKLGMNMATFQLLAAVQGAGEECSQAEIAGRLGVSPATLSETVHVHFKKGLLEQVPSEKDRRVKYLRLTKQGNSKMKDVRKVINDIEEKMTDGISGSSLRSAAQAMDDAIENIEKLITKEAKGKG